MCSGGGARALVNVGRCGLGPGLGPHPTLPSEGSSSESLGLQDNVLHSAVSEVVGNTDRGLEVLGQIRNF